MIMGMSSENGYEKLVAKVPLKEMSSFIQPLLVRLPEAVLRSL